MFFLNFILTGSFPTDFSNTINQLLNSTSAKLCTSPQKNNGKNVWVLSHPRFSFVRPMFDAALLCSHDKLAVRLACKFAVPSLTCGFSTHDTVTLSSITPDSAVVCLQRSFTTLDGTVCEPFELPIKLSGRFSNDHLLLLCACAIICSQYSQLNNIIF